MIIQFNKSIKWMIFKLAREQIEEVLFWIFAEFFPDIVNTYLRCFDRSPL